MRYLVLELAMGLLFVWGYILQFTPMMYVVLWALVCVSLVDLRVGLIPDSVLVFSGLLIFVTGFFWQSSWEFQDLALRIGWGLLAAGFFVFLIIVTKGRGMGWGDVKLAFWMGLVLGWLVVVAVWLAFLTGALGGIILIFVRKKRWGQTMPFGPFLAWGTLVSIWAGNLLVQKFLSLGSL